MNTPLNVTIVGGGTSGWMMAAALSAILPPHACRVTLIESEEIGTVGVGEATLPAVRQFINRVGIDEAEMIRRTHATIKLAIEFVDWGKVGDRYFHTFGNYGEPLHEGRFRHVWTRARQQGRAGAMADYSYAVEMCRRNRFDLPSPDMASIGSTYSYAYQFDASLYGQLLREVSEARGVRRIEGRVVDVTLRADDGHIASLLLQSGEVVGGDLFVDCSGFRSLLIGKALGVPWQDWSHWLPCDRAWAVPCEMAGELTPYTRATACEAGWRWRIPLQHRTGNGYVFCSAFIDDDRAARDLIANLDGATQADPRLLRFAAGRRVRSWDKNCVSLGLASGFLEPLESTSLYLAQIAVTALTQFFPGRDMDPALADEFNRLIDVEYDRIRDFLILHYHATTRDDAGLWNHVRTMEIPDSLKHRIEIFKRRGHIAYYRDGLFKPASWLAVMAGQGIAAEGYEPTLCAVDADTAADTLAQLRGDIVTGVNGLPTHADFLASRVVGGRS